MKRQGWKSYTFQDYFLSESFYLVPLLTRGWLSPNRERPSPGDVPSKMGRIPIEKVLWDGVSPSRGPGTAVPCGYALYVIAYMRLFATVLHLALDHLRKHSSNETCFILHLNVSVFLKHLVFLKRVFNELLFKKDFGDFGHLEKVRLKIGFF